MALWQYMFHVIPKESLNMLPNILDDRDEYGVDDSILWKPLLINKDYFNEISRFLPISKSWSSEIILFGDQESNCFEVSFEDEYIVSVDYRIDFRTDYDYLLSELIDFFIFNGLVILNENWEPILLNIEAIKHILKNSIQFKKYNILSNNKS